MIQLQCKCGKRYTVSDKFAGKRTRCKACSTVLVIPEAPVAEDPTTDAGAVESEAGAQSLDPKAGPRITKKVGRAAARKTTKMSKRRLSERRGGGSKKKRAHPEAAANSEGASKSSRRVVLVVLLVVAVLGVCGYVWLSSNDEGRSSPSDFSSSRVAQLNPDEDEIDVEPEDEEPDELESADSDEEPQTYDEERGSLAAFPPNTNLFVHGDLHGLARFADGLSAFAPIPGFDAGQQLRGGIPPALTASGFDVFEEGNVLWFGGELREKLPGQEQEWMMVLETDQQSELLVGLEAVDVIGKAEHRDGDVVHPVLPQAAEKERAEKLGIALAPRFLTALSDTRLLAANELTFDAAKKAWEGGESILTNEVFDGLTDGFKSRGFLSIAVVVPEDFRSTKDAPINDIQAVHGQLDYTEEGVGKTLKIAVSAAFGSGDSVRQAQELLQQSLAAVPPNIAQIAKPLLGRLSVEREDLILRLSLGIQPSDGPLLMMLASNVMSGEGGMKSAGLSTNFEWLSGLGGGNSAPLGAGPPRPVEVDEGDGPHEDASDDFEIEDDEDMEEEGDDEDFDLDDEDDEDFDLDDEDDEMEEEEGDDEDFGLDDEDDEDMEEEGDDEDFGLDDEEEGA